MNGHISTEFTVWCGTCNEWHQVSAKNQRLAIADFIANGWRKVKSDGWICANCWEKLIGS